MSDRLKFMWRRMGEMLWVKPLVICILSIAAAFIAQMADQMTFLNFTPEVELESIEALLSIISASMLVIAVFTVGAMLSAYQSASSTATPRTFALVVADDVSQNALSTFIGAFIFSIVAQVALMNGYYGDTGRFALFILTVLVFALVIFSFIRWVDRIARLGRLGTLIEKVESATQTALSQQLNEPNWRAVKAEGRTQGMAIYSDAIGYIQRIDMALLQSLAEKLDAHIEVAALPGVFVTPDKVLAYLCCATNTNSGVANKNNTELNKNNATDDDDKKAEQAKIKKISQAFGIGRSRTFDNDPRFGLVVLSEIASRALSPAVNDPGTAISIIGTMVRLFVPCGQANNHEPSVDFDRVAMPAIHLSDLFDDAFNPIARDGAAIIEVSIRLQKALAALAALDNRQMQAAAVAQAQMVFAHAQTALKVPQELERLKMVSDFALKVKTDADTQV